MYRVIFIICIAAVIAVVVMMVAAVAIGKPEGILVFASSGLFFIMWGLMSKSRCDQLGAVYRDVGDDPAGIVERHDFPKSTVLGLVSLQRPTKEYLQLTIAYGIMVPMMLAGAIVIYAVSEGELVFIALGSLLMLGFLWLAVLTFQSFRNWRMAKELDKMES